jgi:hypothetical protein
VKEERIAPEAEAPSGLTQSFQPAPGGHAAKKAKKGEAQMNMDLGADSYGRSRSESLRGAATGAAAPAVRIRLVLSDPASAPGSLRETITRSGGSVMDDRPARPGIIRARIPVLRMNELLESLERLGRVVERPPARDLSGTIEIEIAW